MAQSQVLNVHYLRLQPESELSSPEPSTPPACLSVGQPLTLASALLGLPNRALNPQNHILRSPKMEDTPVKGCGSLTSVGTV